MNHPLVSVIVPVYRVENYLRTCVDSILAQTYSDLEVILVDDGSPDGCPAICDEYAQQDARVRVIHQKNAGLSAARNAGLDLCQGEYITFIDSDDFVHPRFVELLLNACLKEHCPIAISDFKSVPVDADGKEACFSFTDIPSHRITGRNACLMIGDPAHWTRIVTAWGKLYHRSLFAAERFPVGRINEDEALTYKLFYPQASLILCDVPLYFYRSNPASITGQSFSEKRLDIFPILDERVQYYDAHHDDELALKTLVMAFYITGYYYTTFFGKTLTPKLADLHKKYYHALMHRKPSLKAIWDYTSNYISSRFSVFFAAKKR